MAVAFAVLVIIDESFVQHSRNLFLLLLMLAAYVAYMIVAGKNGNAWLRYALKSKGYVRLTDRDA